MTLQILVDLEKETELDRLREDDYQRVQRWAQTRANQADRVIYRIPITRGKPDLIKAIPITPGETVSRWGEE